MPQTLEVTVGEVVLTKMTYGPLLQSTLSQQILELLVFRAHYGIKTCLGCQQKMHMIKAAVSWVQAGLAGSHPVQKERELLQAIKRNPYQHALLCIHQAPYQPDRRTQAELLQVQPPSNQSCSTYMPKKPPFRQCCSATTPCGSKHF